MGNVIDIAVKCLLCKREIRLTTSEILLMQSEIFTLWVKVAGHFVPNYMGNVIDIAVKCLLCKREIRLMTSRILLMQSEIFTLWVKAGVTSFRFIYKWHDYDL